MRSTPDILRLLDNLDHQNADSLEDHGKIRIGKECKPLTGTLRRRIAVETGENDFSSQVIAEAGMTDFSPAALETLRESARLDNAPEDLVRMSDRDMLEALGLLREGRMTVAALLLAGSPEALRKYLPSYGWSFFLMEPDTGYRDRVDDHDSLPIALKRLAERINANNPISTVAVGLAHFEYRMEVPQVQMIGSRRHARYVYELSATS